jgi:hypothetical protein
VKKQKTKPQSYVVFTRHDGATVRVPVPDEPDGEAAALGDGLERLAASGEWKADDGEPMAAEDFYREIGYTPPAEPKHNGAVAKRQVSPKPTSR